MMAHSAISRARAPRHSQADAVEANTLYAIASQCPMVGGNAVYRARALYSLVDDEEEFDDPAICLQQGIIVRSADEDGGNVVQVLPNPATDEATPIYQLDEGATGEFIIRDAMGRAIARHNVGSEQNRFAFSTTQLAAGLYHFVLIVDDEQVGDGKLTIVR